MTKNQLREKAKKKIDEFFGNIDEGAYEKYLNHYCTRLFPSELEIVKASAEDKLKNVIPSKAIMIMTLGTSPEPLLLAAHLVKPEKLFILCTESSHERTLKDALSKTDWAGCNLQKINLGKEATSASVFKTLRGKGNPGIQNPELPELTRILQDEAQRNRIVFDITGAKKTISGGCLLFASYYDIPVYYMDFGEGPDDYHPDLGRPLPGACYYTRQKNPISGFCLKDIDRIKDHFDKGQYDIAAELLKNVIVKMDEDYFDQTERELFGGLLNVTRIYADWIGGWWGDVNAEIKTLPPSNQPYVKKLSIYPKKNKEEWKEPVFQTDMYDAPGDFLTYLVMELATLSRAVANKTMNPRNIFLRIFSLEEILVGFMCYQLLKVKKIGAEISNPSELSDEMHNKLAVTCNYGGLESLLRGTNYNKGYYPIEQRLFRPNIKGLKWNKKNPPVVKLLLLDKKAIQDNIKEQLTIFSEDNRGIRNKAVHSITPVDEDTAKKIRNAFESLLRELLYDVTMPWFVGAENIDAVKKLLANNNWFEDERVSPMKWDACESLIQAVSALSSTTP